MNFLALSTFQVILLASLTAIAVIVPFLLKFRHRPAVVGSLLLWQRMLDEELRRSWLEKLARWISLLLALTIALLIALAIGRPYIEAQGSATGPVIVILDTSLSMESVTASGQTRWEVAVDRARALLSAGNPTFGFIATDTGGGVQIPLTHDLNEALGAIDQMRPRAGEPRLPELPGEANAYLITDGVALPPVPSGVETISVLEPGDNVAVTAFAIRADPTSRSGYVAYLEIVNYSAIPKDVAVRVSGMGSQRIGDTVQLNPGEGWKTTLSLTEFEGGAVRVDLETSGDRLALDNVAFAYLPVHRPIRLDLVTFVRDGFLEAVLRLSPNVDLRVVSPDLFDEATDAEAFVFEDFVPETVPSKPALIFGAGNALELASSSGNQESVSITSWEAEHPIMTSVPVRDIQIGQPAQLEPGDGTVVAASEDAPLIIVDESRRIVRVGFDLASSDFPLQVGFPILVQNVLSWFSGETTAEPSGLGVIELPVEASSVVRLNGIEVPTERQFGRSVLEVAEPGLIVGIVDGRPFRIAVNMTDRRLSNINRSALEATTGPPAAASEFGAAELWFSMLMLALVLMSVEWFTYHRGFTV